MVSKLLAPLEHEGGEELIEIQDAEEETEPLKIAKGPPQPTQQQEEDHRITHNPYRTWCKWCIMGRALGEQHGAGHASGVPRIGVDYFFITSGGVKKRDELEFPLTPEGDELCSAARKKGDVVKCIVVRCWETKNLFGHCIPCKGDDEEHYVAGLVADDGEWLGHTKIILKYDNEPAIKSMMAEATKIIKAKCEKTESVSHEEPPKYSSQSNGGTEVGIRIIRGMFRTLKLCLEARIGKYIPITHALVPWLLEHVCLLLNAQSRGHDGLTPWQRVRGRPFSQKLVGFGEVVLYKLPTKGPQHNPDGNMGTRWREGVFLGYSRSSHTYTLATPDGKMQSRALMRRPPDNRWSQEALAGIKTTPWLEREKPEVQARFQQEAQEQDSPPAVDVLPAVRRLRINKSDLYAHGYTQGCRQCEYTERNGKARGGMQHSTACRQRIIEAIGQTEEGKQRIAEHDERVNTNIAERIEKEDETRAAEHTNVATARDMPPAVSSSSAREELAGPNVLSSKAPGEERSRDKREPFAPDESAAPTHEPPDMTTAAHSQTGTDASLGEAAKHEDTPEHGGDTEMAQAHEPEDEFMGFIGSLEPAKEDEISAILLQQLGSFRKSYQRETRTKLKQMIEDMRGRKVVSEIYSPPRITAELKKNQRRHLIPGFALDLTVADPDDGTPWDFSKPEKRAKARALLRKQRPYMLIGSPMCTAFSSWQQLNRARSKDVDKMDREKDLATQHIEFVISLYVEQLEGGRYFLHEHPRRASSWGLQQIRDLLKMPGVDMVAGDQCQFGAEVADGKDKGRPLLKPTGFMSNAPCLLEALAKRCRNLDGMCSRVRGGRHVVVEGELTKKTAIYPRGLCRAVLRGTTAQLRHDRRMKPLCHGIQAVDDEEEIIQQINGPSQGFSGKYKDDLTGQVLRDDLVIEARAKELDYFHSKGVWLKVPRSRARCVTGRPPISVRWVDVNKGDEANPNYRSRLVARQIKALDKSGQSYFAPAPPLEALRLVLSLAMTCIGDHQPDWDPESPTRTQVSFVDITRAYFNAAVDRSAAPCFVDLPKEDADSETMCGELLRHMYGTRMAADGWQEEYSTFLISLGFLHGTSCPNVFYHRAKGIVCSVHGDDFTSSGPKDSLDWLEESICSIYEATVGPRLGPGKHDAKEARALNRIVRWQGDRIEYEADPRQIERLISECGLEGAKAMSTPGVRHSLKEIEADEDLPANLHTAFRGAAARGNYLSADRIDVQFGCKEICRWMSKPTNLSWQALKRLCRYFNGMQRLVYTYRKQTVDKVDVYTDTDWAGCPKTRKSTSGGCVLLGRHTIKHWSSTQANVALSSGEAEFNGVVRAGGQGLGFQALLRDCGVEAPLRVWTDSSAAIGICTRQGLGKLRHLDTHTLWIQQAVRSKRIDLRKVLGDENPADLLTKHSLSRERLLKLVTLYDCEFQNGRAESAPMLRKGESTKVTMAQGNLNAACEESGEPWMPHNVLDGHELDKRFPTLSVPDEEELADIVKDADDVILMKGVKIAGDITKEMQTNGRTRSTPSRPASRSARSTSSPGISTSSSSRTLSFRSGATGAGTASPRTDNAATRSGRRT